MIVEKAFFNLPEILTGYGYQEQEYEAGIVGAFSLALLQELNARNVCNPISCMMLERPYRSKDEERANDQKQRFLRCDLFLNTASMFVGTAALHGYGYEDSNWIEAKFFRCYGKDGRPKRSTNPTNNTVAIVADLLRLASLVQFDCSDGCDKNGRYLLHVYSESVTDHVLVEGRGKNRQLKYEWQKALCTEGSHVVIIEGALRNKKPILEQVGAELSQLEVRLEVRNYIIDHTHKASEGRRFVCVLTRIDGFSLKLGGSIMSRGKNRQVLLQPANAGDEISGFVCERLNTKDKADATQPDRSWERLFAVDLDLLSRSMKEVTIKYLSQYSTKSCTKASTGEGGKSDGKPDKS